MLDSWIDEARQFAGSVQPSVIIVGCKLDLVDVGCRRVVSAEDAQKKAESLGALYTETSSKHAVGVEETFRILCQDILTRVVKGDISVKYEEYKLLNSIVSISVTRQIQSRLVQLTNPRAGVDHCAGLLRMMNT